MLVETVFKTNCTEELVISEDLFYNGPAKVKILGWGFLQLVKQTNIQATGVASGLVEIIEQAGFKMQALSLGFDDDDAEDDEYIDYDSSTYTEEEEATTE